MRRVQLASRLSAPPKRYSSAYAATRSAAANAPDPRLVDSFGRRHNYLRISLSERCNLRCTYCMPEDGVDLTPEPKLLTTPEILRLASAFVQSGVDKIRLTGGEPLIRKDVEDVLRGLRRIHGLKTIGITTNGILVGRKLPTLAECVDQINISLDTLDPMKFVLITRRNGWERVRAAIDLAIDAAIPQVKVNVVVVRGVNDMEIADFVALTESMPIEVRFIEYMPFDDNKWAERKLVPYAEMLAIVKARYAAITPLSLEPNHTSKAWRVDGHRGSFGFITSMSEHFCASCNRMRLTADGNFKGCLFGPNEVNLADALRRGASDSDIIDIVSAALQRKKRAHAGMHTIAVTKNRPMIKIGG